MKKALITGISGQDGFYLSKFLQEKGYEVHGIDRDNKTQLTNVKIYQADIIDKERIIDLIKEIQPNEVYHLASISNVSYSIENPEETLKINSGGTKNILEAVKNIDKNIKVFCASTAEIYGNTTESPQTEQTPFSSRNPYGKSKIEAYLNTKMYRDDFNIFAVSGILYNHESPRRPNNFVTKKIIENVVKISKKELDHFELGNLDMKRDWGYAKDYVEAMWLMLQYETPIDLIISTGKATTVREFVKKAFSHVNIEIKWQGTPGTVEEIGICSKSGDNLVKVNKEFFRPNEKSSPLGNPEKALKTIGWKAQTSVDDLIKLMIQAELT